MHLKDFVKVYDNFLNKEQLQDLLNFTVKQNFQKGLIANENDKKEEQNKSRIVDILELSPTSQSMTNVVWFNVLKKLIKEKYTKYVENFHKDYLISSGMYPLQILRYSSGGQHTPHVDHCGMYPRTLSVVVFLNDDYTGGELIFPKHDNLNIYLKVDKKPGRCVIFPSNFLFPHTVTPIETGTRYSFITWLN